MSAHASPQEIHAKLGHPVIDGDGHWVEYTPVFAEKMRKAAGDKAADGFIAAQRRIPDSLNLSIEERKRRGIGMEGYWGRQTTNTRDRATAMMPRMLYDRLDELGIDFGIIYPTAGLGIHRIPDGETRRAVIRGFNIVSADYFAKLSDRLTPAAVIPMHTPEEALAELEYVTGQLGAKVCMFGSSVARRLPAAEGIDPALARFTVGFDQLGIDSEHDYDPVWQKCRELKIAPTFHTGGRSYGERNSPSNFTFNHIGHFAAAGHAVAKALFLGGVTRRFPELRFGFLEGGVGWGCQLFADLIEHWERRGAKGLAYMHPDKLDRSLLRKYVDEYGYGDIAAELDRRDGWPAREEDTVDGGVPVHDDYAACKITRKEDWLDLYAKPYYFGCEADDRMNVTAFGRANPFGARINAIFSSDIGHFDVPDMLQPLPEAYELVEDGLITADDFRDFTFSNAVRLWGTQNPRFFEGTRIAREAAALLAEAHAPTRAAAE
ncbi:MAG TPA: amidohydrolase family protein [Stellaceae bacterium]|jgi:predicted TIM-barrel fold metal-dependent hydrolase|nr:amidohydrolase family protein [Stellaceae bacterium]